MQHIVDGLKKVVCSNEIFQETVQAALKSVIQQRCAFRAQCILRVNKASKHLGKAMLLPILNLSVNLDF